jgi:DNA-binding transcriptional LysR family regulator
MDEEAGQPLDLRRLRYFVAVAEELHFGRAAERLYVAQPVLSRHVQKLELELGTDLFVRTSRNVELTAAGRRLLDEARQLLSAADAARRRMQGVADGHATLTVGFFVGDYFTPAARAFLAKRPEAELKFLRIYWHDQVEVLQDGRADVAFVHLPVEEEGSSWSRSVPSRASPCYRPTIASPTARSWASGSSRTTRWSGSAGPIPPGRRSTTSTRGPTVATRTPARPSRTSRRSSRSWPQASPSPSCRLPRRRCTGVPRSSTCR